jgi:class 3 adenylate cyclase
MDFTFEIISADDESQTLHLAIIPDARRYEMIERDGEKFYFDKFLRHLIPVDEMKTSMMQQVAGLPIYSLTPTIKSTGRYADKRRSAVTSELRTGQYLPPEEAAVQHQSVVDDPKTRGMVFISVDICGSSALRQKDQNSFDAAYRIFVRELGTVVGQFNGSIFKLTGDGLIAVIDHPSFTRQCDNAVDMGLSFLVVLRDAVNPALEEAGLTPFRIKVGADYGDAQIQKFDIPKTGYSAPEIASDALNRAVKIQSSCCENEFRIGRTLYELVHVQWLERAQCVPFDGSAIGVPEYSVYRVL